jgi:hypothetical protein
MLGIGVAERRAEAGARAQPRPQVELDPPAAEHDREPGEADQHADNAAGGEALVGGQEMREQER